MASEIVEPEIERVKLSIAEENLLEQMRNYVSKLAVLLQEIEVAMDDLFRQKFELAKTRIVKIFEDVKSIYEYKSSLARYASKISVSIANGFYYLSLVDSISSLTDTLHKLSLDLGLLCSIKSSASESLVISIQSTVGQLRDYITSIQELLLYLIESPSKVSGSATLIEKKFYDILQTLRSVHEDLGYELREPVLINIITTLTALAHNLHNLGEKTVWMYLIRAS